MIYTWVFRPQKRCFHQLAALSSERHIQDMLSGHSWLAGHLQALIPCGRLRCKIRTRLCICIFIIHVYTHNMIIHIYTYFDHALSVCSVYSHIVYIYMQHDIGRNYVYMHNTRALTNHGMIFTNYTLDVPIPKRVISISPSFTYWTPK